MTSISGKPACEDTDSRVWISIYSQAVPLPEMEKLLQIKALWLPPKRTPGKDYTAIDSRQKPNGLHILSDLAMPGTSPIEEHLDWAADYIADSTERIRAFLKQDGNSGVVTVVCVSSSERIDYTLEPKIQSTFQTAGLTLEFGFEYDGSYRR